MTFNEIVKAVIIDTSRPDMGPAAPFTFQDFIFPGGGDDRIPQRVASVTLALHTMDFFYKDISPQLLSLEASAWIQSVDTSVFPRYRALSYIRKYDINYLNSQLNPSVSPPQVDSTGLNSSPQDLNMLEIITPGQIFDYFGSEKSDVAYVAGTSLMMKSSTAFKQALIGFYAYPNTDWKGGNFASWIADEYGQAVVDATVSAIFATIGKQEQSRKYDDPKTGLVPMWRRIIASNNIVARGS